MPPPATPSDGPDSDALQRCSDRSERHQRRDRADPTRRELLAAGLVLPLAGLPILAGAAPAPVMLAGVYRPGIDLPAYRVSEKFDGVRGWWDGDSLRTRSGTRVAAPAWFTAGWPASPMDGEIWAGRGRFDAAQSAVARARPDDAAWRALRYPVFDRPAEPGGFDARYGRLRPRIAALSQPWVGAVEQSTVADEAALQSLLQRTVRAGGEGLMLHRGDAPYRAARSDDLLKLKPSLDAEARVVAHVPGRGRLAGQVGALDLETPEGLRFRVGSGLADAQRRQPPPIGAWVTYRYQGLHASGIPRFAHFVRVRGD